jgi:hypothetical protein
MFFLALGGTMLVIVGSIIVLSHLVGFGNLF